MAIPKRRTTLSIINLRASPLSPRPVVATDETGSRSQ
jgi:hypothetical protein